MGMRVHYIGNHEKSSPIFPSLKLNKRETNEKKEETQQMDFGSRN